MIRRLMHRLGLGACPECEILVEYALEGLPEGQQGTVRRHLADCPPCREQVRDYWQVREGLGLCAGERDAPDDLCAKVLARLGEQPGGAPEAAPFLLRPRLSGWPRFWMLVGPAFAVLSLVMTLVALLALSRGAAAPAPRPGAAALASAASAPAAASLAPGEDLAALVRAVVDDPRAARVALASAGPAGSGAGGLLVLCPGMDHAYLRCERLAPSPRGGAYVLWVRTASGAPQRLSSFTVEKAGTGVYLLVLDRAFSGSGALEFLVTRPGASAAPGPAWLKGSVRL